MIEVRFHEELYDASALDEAVELYAPYANVSLAREPGGATVKIEAQEGGEDEALIAAELANYALGKTIERSRSAADAAPKNDGASKEAA